MPATTISGKVKSLIDRAFQNPRSMLEKAISDGLPEIVHEPCRYLISGEFPDQESQAVAERVESRRAEIATTLEGPIEIIYSPKPGSAETPDRPEEGSRLLFTPERVASTGKNAQWGGFLFMCARSASSRTAIELGSNLHLEQRK